VSRWVNEEILRFGRLGRAERILCVIVSGEPTAAGDDATAGREAFPQALSVVLAGASLPSTTPSDGPLATDLRTGGDGKRLALLKVVAGLLRLPLGDLVRRDQRRRRWQAVQATAILLIVGLVAGGVWRDQQEKIKVQREVAATQALATRAQGLLRDVAHLPTAALLAVTAWRRALELNLPAQEIFDVMQRSASLLPPPAPLRLKIESLRLQNRSPLGAGVASADGRWFATGGDKSVPVWDARSGQLTAILPTDDRVDALAFVNATGELAVVAGGHLQTWVPAYEASRKGTRRIAGLAYPAALSADGRWLAAGLESSGNIGVWDVTTGELKHQLPVDVPVTKLSISPDGRRLAAGVAGMSNSGPVDPGWRLWDLDKEKLLVKGKAPGFVGGLAFSGQMLAIGNGNIELRDAATGSELSSIRGSADTVVWAPNGRWIASSGDPVRVWDAESGEEVARVPAGGLVGFTADGTLVTADGRSWTMNTDLQLERLLRSAGGTGINSIDFAGVSRMVTAHQSGEVATWRLDTGQRGPILREDLAAHVVASSGDGRFVLTMSGNTLGSMWSARLWDAQTGSKLAELAPGGHIEGASFSADGNQLAVVDDLGVLTLYATNNASVVETAKMPLKGGGNGVGTVPGSEGWLVTGNDAALVWRPGSEPKFLNVGENPVFDVIASSDGSTLWQTGQDVVIARDAITLQERRRIDKIGGRVRALAMSQDGDILTVLLESAIRVFDGRTGAPSFDLSLPDTAGPTSGPKEAEPAGAMGTVLSPDGRWLALVVQKRDAQQDLVHDVSLWSLEKRTRVAVLEQGVQSASFSVDGTRLATISREGSVRLAEWIPTRLVAELCRRVGRDLTADERKQYFSVEDGRPACP
jgi:WD40 repeat protein